MMSDTSPERRLEDDLPDDAKAILSRFLGEDNGAALSFFSDDDLERASGAGNNPHFTAGYIRSRSPRLYRAIVALTGADYSLREVSQLLGVSKNTVSSVIESEPDAVGTLKQRTAKTLRRAAHRLAERILDRTEDIPIGQAAVTLGIVIDKAQLLDGEATAIIESRPSARHADWEETLIEVQALKQAAGRVIEADTETTGLTSGAGLQKGGSAALVAPDQDEDDDVQSVTVDCVSTDLQADNREVSPDAVVSACGEGAALVDSDDPPASNTPPPEGRGGSAKPAPR